MGQPIAHGVKGRRRLPVDGPVPVYRQAAPGSGAALLSSRAMPPTACATRLALALALLGCERPRAAPPRAPAPPATAVPSPAPAPTATATPEDAGVGYVEITTGGAPADARLPMIVAVHGLGDRPENFLPLFAGLDARARVVAVRGLDPWGEGFAWFPLGAADRAEGNFRRATEALAGAVAVLARSRPTCGLPVVTGFSQGGMLSFALAARVPVVVRAAVPVAGRLPRAFWPEPRPVGGLLPEVFALHGEADPRMSIADGRATVGRLAEVGFPATLRTYPGVGHTISPAMQRDLYDALRRLVAQGGC